MTSEIHSMIEIDQLTKEFRSRSSVVKAVDNISFSVKKEDIFGFLGPNGAGKTTTVRMITGVLEPDSGTVSVNGMDVTEKPVDVKCEIGIAPEVPDAYIDLTGWENLDFIGKLYDVPKDKRKDRGNELLKTFGIHDRKDSKVKGYSKGMKKRLILAISMIHDPSLIFLDEPISGLDVQSQRLIKERIREVNNEGKTIFLTTHNIPVANELCDRVAVINNGKIAAIETPENLKNTIKGTQSVQISFKNDLPSKIFEEFEFVEKIEKRGDKYRIFTSDPIKIVEKLMNFSKKKNEQILTIKTKGPSLEDAFVRLTEGS